MRGGLGNETVTNSARTQFPASVTSELPTNRTLLNAGAFVRTHLASFAKRRARADDGHRAFTTCAVSSLGKLKSATSALTRSF
jgi:hypothetical protein